MPIVSIQLMEGRPPERIEAMHAAVAEAIASSIGAPIESVRILVREMQAHQFSVGGRLIDAVKAERADHPEG
jgi:4-oxalocrotonate tautomerase